MIRQIDLIGTARDSLSIDQRPVRDSLSIDQRPAKGTLYTAQRML